MVVSEKATTPMGKPVTDLVRRLALIHDFGKLTTWFQQHIEMMEGDPRGNPTHHALIGAVLSYYVLERAGYEDEECLAGYVAVAKHHGSLPDVPEYVFDRTNWNKKHPVKNERHEEVIEQVENIDKKAAPLAEEFISEATDGRGSWAEFAARVRERTQFETIKDRVSYSGYTHDAYGISEEFYPCVLQAWSALSLADKTSAAGAPKGGYESTAPVRSALAEYINGLPKNGETLSDRERRLNDWRDEARVSVLKNVERMVTSDERLATLTLPTGMGKTLTGLDTALTLREETDRERIVYALPFTSIIDQVDSEIREIFDTDGRDDLLTVHHHLAETVIELDEEDTDEYAAIEEMLGESWRSGLVLTTYVQLFESLVGPRNTQSMKLPALYDSVIVLDEPQSLPHDWWPLVRRLATILTEEYDATVIAMTATQPQLFGGVLELVDGPRRYFEEIERVEYVIDDSVVAFPDREHGPIGYDEAGDRIVGSASDGEDVLSVCNTIDSAQTLTEVVTKRVDAVDVGKVYADLLRDEGEVDGGRLADAVVEKADSVATVHLSTRIRPKDRLVLIGAIKTLTTGTITVVAVTTQLIEAGVDVSFDRVYRDFAPMDSIVQAAGRCNRSFERDSGTVTVWWLDKPEEKNMTPGEAVYNEWGDSLLSVTSQVLDSKGVNKHSTSPEFTIAWDCIREYYRVLRSERRVGKESYVDLLNDGEFEQAGRLSLIDQRLAFEVVVCRTDRDRERIIDIKDAWSDFKFDTVRTLIEETKSAQVSIPVYRADSKEAEKIGGLDQVHDETDLRWLDTRDHLDYFDKTTGLVVPDSTVEGRFL
jgi:CRISPR-associated endonuclease Cas3-HD